MSEKSYDGAVKILSKYGAPIIPSQMNIYKNLAVTLL